MKSIFSIVLKILEIKDYVNRYFPDFYMWTNINMVYIMHLKIWYRSLDNGLKNSEENF